MFDIYVEFPYKIEINIFQNSRVKRIQEIFEATIKKTNQNDEIIHKLLPTLFMSMLPLHPENKKRQMALFANAMLIHERNFG